MGKGHQHMKKLKSEKAKVKLKGSKHLPKGTNVTDTNFKIKQIVVREQLKAKATGAEPLSKRKLNIKELLSRLQHYNTTVKSDAITDLKEIITLYPSDVVLPNLNQFINGVSHLVLDKEKLVRQNALRLISLILSQVSVEQVTPFFDILSSYFRCAMTHIDTAIQEDSLLLLDVLLEHIPSLIATHSNKILENFFDLISKLRSDSKPGRTLTLNLDSKLTTVKWRIKVLNRLDSILEAIIKDKQKSSFDEVSRRDSQKHQKNEIFYPVYRHDLEACVVPLNDVGKITNSSKQDNNIVKYVDSLIPLLFETWLEVGPNGKEDSALDVTLTEETASALNCILNIFYLLHTFLKLNGKETGNNELLNKFILKYRRDFSKFIISQFPYSKIVSKKRKRNEKNTQVANSSFCTTENFMICNLFCIFNNKINSNTNQKENAEKLTNYVENILTSYNPENSDDNKYALLLLKNLLLNVSKSWNCCNNQLIHILNSTLDLYSNKKLNWDLKCELFNILCDIVHHDQFNKSPQFQIWLSTLPDLLCREEISEKTINMINLLVKQNNTLFNNALQDKFNDILGNLSRIKILETNDEIFAKYKIISLVHFLPVENTFTYVNTIASSDCDTILKKYFQEILILKFEQRNEGNIVDKLGRINFE